jgi:hypothetical protein
VVAGDGGVVRRPLNFEVMVAVFGDPRLFIGADGHISEAWPNKILGMAQLPAPLPLSWDRTKEVRRFRCHRYLVGHFERALAAIHDDETACGTVNDFGGCYAFRMVRGSRLVPSAHSWGAAIDLDVLDNPQGRAPVVHPTVIEAFEAEGFLWGGNFKGKRRDGMHFEFSDIERLRVRG